MTTTGYLQVLRRRWWVVAVGALLGAALGWGASKLTTPLYTATTQVFVYQSVANSAADLSNGASFTRNQITSFAELASAPVVLDPVIKSLHLDTTAGALGRTIAVTNPTDTTILTITAADESPDLSAQIANAVARQFAVVIDDVAPVDDAGKTTVAVTTIAPATPPSTPSSPRVAMNTGLGLLAGALAGGLVLFAILRFDTRVRTKLDVARVTSVPATSAIGLATGEGLIMLTQPNSAVAENFRQLRADLQFATIDADSVAIVVTSSVVDEGKTTVSCNLALAWAETGARVLLIDADLHRPAVADRFGLEGRGGLTTLLVGRAKLVDVVRPWGGSSLEILTAGGVPPNPSELIASKRMASVLGAIVPRYDVVIIDAAPGGDLAAPAVLARHASGTLIVADATSIRAEQLQHTVTTLQTAGAHILGVTLNKVKQATTPYTYAGLLPIQEPDRGPVQRAEV